MTLEEIFGADQGALGVSLHYGTLVSNQQFSKRSLVQAKELLVRIFNFLTLIEMPRKQLQL